MFPSRTVIAGTSDRLRVRINILSNVTVPLAGLVDTAMLGHLSDYRFLAGVGLGTVLFIAARAITLWLASRRLMRSYAGWPSAA